MRQSSLTTPLACNANAVQLPTSPPPPMMETFIASTRLQLRHHLIRDRLHQLVNVSRHRLGFAIRLALAGVAVDAANAVRLVALKDARLQHKLRVSRGEHAVAANVAIRLVD